MVVGSATFTGDVAARCHGTVTGKSNDVGLRRGEFTLTASNPVGEITTRAAVTLRFA